MSAPLAIVNLRSTSRPVAAIKYFANPKKVTATYDGLATGVAVGTPEQLAELLLANHHDRRAKRVCRTAVISVQTPLHASKEQLDDIDKRLLQAARDFQKALKIASMLGWVHGDTLTRHIHLFFSNSDSRRTLDIRPKLLKELQGFLWTVQFLSGRGKGRRKALPFYPKAKKLDVRALAFALFDSAGRLRKERWEQLVKTGKVSDFRQRKDGSLISFQFQGRRIRFATLKNYLVSMSENAGEANSGVNMTTLINANEPIPTEVQGTLDEAGFTSAEVQQILQDIRAAQGHLATKPVVKTIQPQPDFSL